MTDLRVKSGRSSSGARIIGDDLQHLVAWYCCLKAIAEPDKISSVEIEAANAGSFDDVVVTFANGEKKYIQVKAAVSNESLVSVEWLIQNPKPSASTGSTPPSLLQKFYRSWVKFGRPQKGLELVTSRLIDSSDVLLQQLDRYSTLGLAFQYESNVKLDAEKVKLKDHLNCSESELWGFLNALAIRTGQNEREWLSKIADVAIGAGIRYDEDAVSIGLNWIREWVKTTRDARTSKEITEAVAKIGLRSEVARELIVIQGLQKENADEATHVLDWTNRFRGDKASNRRGMIVSDDWTGFLTDALSELRDALVLKRSQRVLVRGSLRLPCWFAVGAALSGSSGFDLAIEYRNAVWAPSLNRITSQKVNIVIDEKLGDGPTLLVMAISTNRTEDVKKTLDSPCFGRIITLTFNEGPGQNLITGADHALSAAISARDWVRANIQNSDVHLVLMAPAPFATFLGWVWDRMPKTIIYEDLIREYEAAFVMDNVVGLEPERPSST